ncbi:MAG TPA: hypothetical protein VME19_08570 [Streptosporangiaceae bacterium]|nr:hypothetical protein [Streptosporangiaceae bacterium]
MANQIWEFKEFPGPSPNGESNAVTFLNDPDRQGRGEAAAALGLLYLAPGSLGTSTVQTWYSKEFPVPHGVRDALTFLNAHPRQGEGEVSGYAHGDGSAAIFYLEPGSN